jgi:hypothetical protein
MLVLECKHPSASLKQTAFDICRRGSLRRGGGLEKSIYRVRLRYISAHIEYMGQQGQSAFATSSVWPLRSLLLHEQQHRLDCPLPGSKDPC